MKRIVYVILLVTSFAFSQNEITMNLGDFHTVKTYRGLQVELIESKESKAIIDGKKSSEVTIKNSNGVLKISLSISNTFSSDDVMVYLYYSKDIDVIDANEGSHIYSDAVVKQDKLEVNAQEAAKIKLKLEVGDLKVTTNTGGEIKLSGSVDNQSVKSNTGGIYKGERLDTKTTVVSSNTGGTAEVNATDKVDANASTGGTITIQGDPAEVKKKESLGGYVRQ